MFNIRSDLFLAKFTTKVCFYLRKSDIAAPHADCILN